MNGVTWNMLLLQKGAKMGEEAIVKLLLEEGADIEVKGSYSRTPLL